MLNTNCKNCGQGFVISDEDLKFYEKVGPVIKGEKFPVSPPSFCPDCRHQRRLTFRNERKLYKRKCDVTGNEIISIYSPDKPYKVYERELWWDDKNDAIEYGRDFDFSRPFFEQFAELKAEVPHMALIASNNENSEYTNLESDVKNCYMNFGGHFSEECYYNLYCMHGTNCVDNYWVDHCELSYMNFRCFESYKLIYSYWCFNCSDCSFCMDCRGCSDCFGCVGLRRKKYCFFNEQLSEGEYKKLMSEIVLSPEKVDWAKECLQELWNEVPHMGMTIENCENSFGDFVKNCKNCEQTYETYDAEDCKFLDVAGMGMTDCYDITRAGLEAELCYEVTAGTFIKNVLFSNMSYDHIYMGMYTDCCINSKYLFGCTNLHNKEYCILNKQYTKEEWEELVPRIIKHMMKTGEWGEFFPSSLSPFAYNETVAIEYISLTKEEALAAGYKWLDEDSRDYKAASCEVPEDIRDVKDSILGDALACRKCFKNYRLIPQELAFYRTMGLPVPVDCPDCRHFERIKFRNPHQIFERECGRCHKGIKSVFSEEMPEKVCCEGCYQSSIN